MHGHTPSRGDLSRKARPRGRRVSLLPQPTPTTYPTFTRSNYTPESRRTGGPPVTIPTFDKFIERLLRVLHDHPDGLKAADAYEATADCVGLSDEQRDEMIPSGQQPVYKSRIGWTHDRLKRADLSHSPSWGVWQLTDKGEELV